MLQHGESELVDYICEKALYWGKNLRQKWQEENNFVLILHKSCECSCYKQPSATNTAENPN